MAQGYLTSLRPETAFRGSTLYLRTKAFIFSGSRCTNLLGSMQSIVSKYRCYCSVRIMESVHSNKQYKINQITFYSMIGMCFFHVPVYASFLLIFLVANVAAESIKFLVHCFSVFFEFVGVMEFFFTTAEKIFHILEKRIYSTVHSCFHKALYSREKNGTQRY